MVQIGKSGVRGKKFTLRSKYEKHKQKLFLLVKSLSAKPYILGGLICSSLNVFARGLFDFFGKSKSNH